MGFQTKGRPIETKAAAIDQAVRFLSFRALSTQELLQKLKRKGISDEWCEEVLAQMTEWGYIDDVALARDAARVLMDSRKYSLRMIQQKLKQRGLAEPPELRKYDELAVAFRLIERKFPIPEDWDESQEKPFLRRKFMQFLMNRGFSSSTASTVCQEYQVYLS